MDQLNNTCIVEKIVDPEQENTVKSHNVLLKLLNPGLEENIWRNSPASTLLILKPAERHTLPSPRNQSKGEAEIEKTFAMREAALTSGSKSRSKKKRHNSESPHLVPRTRRRRRSGKQQAQQAAAALNGATDHNDAGSAAALLLPPQPQEAPEAQQDDGA